MPIALVGTPQVTSIANSQTINATLPSGIVAGTVLKAVLSYDETGHTFTPPAGWTIDRTDNISNGDGQTAARASRVSDGSDGATATFTATPGAHNFSVIVAAFSGVDNVVTERSSTFNNPNLVTPPSSPVTLTALSVTAVAGDELLVLCVVDTTGNDGTYSGFPGFTLFQTNPLGTFNSAALGYAPVSSSGATGDQTGLWTVAATSGNFVAYLIALQQFVNTVPSSYPLESNEYF